MRKRVLGYLAVALVLAMAALVLLSWMLSATQGGNVRSMLSAEGIRFFFGSFVNMLQTPLLVWLLLLAMAWGAMQGSGLLTLFSSLGKHATDSSARKRRRTRQSIVLLACLLAGCIGLILLLTAVPHAVLLSATGRLWPSPFSRALVPVIAFIVVLLSTAYGLVTRRFLSVSDICQSLIDGISTAAPLFLLYVLAMQLYASLRFVFGG